MPAGNRDGHTPATIDLERALIALPEGAWRWSAWLTLQLKMNWHLTWPDGQRRDFVRQMPQTFSISLDPVFFHTFRH